MIIDKLKKNKQLVFIQAKIDKELAMETKKIIKQYGFKMRHVIESCLQAFVAEVKKNAKPK